MTKPTLTIAINEEARARSLQIIAAALTPNLGAVAAQLAARALTGPGFEILLAQVFESPGVDIQAVELDLLDRDD